MPPFGPFWEERNTLANHSVLLDNSWIVIHKEFSSRHSAYVNRPKEGRNDIFPKRKMFFYKISLERNIKRIRGKRGNKVGLCFVCGGSVCLFLSFFLYIQEKREQRLCFWRPFLLLVHIFVRVHFSGHLKVCHVLEKRNPKTASLVWCWLDVVTARVFSTVRSLREREKSSHKEEGEKERHKWNWRRELFKRRKRNQKRKKCWNPLLENPPTKQNKRTDVILEMRNLG